MAMNAHPSTSALRILLGTLAVGALGCVDPSERYDAFIERTAAIRDMDSGMVEPGDRFDWSGRYLLSLSTSLSPTKPLLFTLDAEVSDDLTTLDLTFQPLTTDGDEEPRTPIGDAFSVNAVPYASDGTFSADLGEVTAPGRANPITGSAIIATVQLIARTQAGDSGAEGVVCGQVTGMVSVPLALDLAGSTFGAVLTDEPQDVEPLLGCP
jgi:hypothetical protein